MSAFARGPAQLPRVGIVTSVLRFPFGIRVHGARRSSLPTVKPQNYKCLSFRVLIRYTVATLHVSADLLYLGLGMVPLNRQRMGDKSLQVACP